MVSGEARSVDRSVGLARVQEGSELSGLRSRRVRFLFFSRPLPGIYMGCGSDFLVSLASVLRRHGLGKVRPGRALGNLGLDSDRTVKVVPA